MAGKLNVALSSIFNNECRIVSADITRKATTQGGHHSKSILMTLTIHFLSFTSAINNDP
jgi:hypothetical protein